MRYLLVKIGLILSIFFTEKRYSQYKRMKYYLFSKMAMHWFKSTGKRIRICPPLILGGSKYITIGENFSILERGRIEAIDSYAGRRFEPKIVIGNNVVINSDCHLGAINAIRIDVVFISRIIFMEN